MVRTYAFNCWWQFSKKVREIACKLENMEPILPKDFASMYCIVEKGSWEKEIKTRIFCELVVSSELDLITVGAPALWQDDLWSDHFAVKSVDFTLLTVCDLTSFFGLYGHQKKNTRRLKEGYVAWNA